MFKKEIQKLIYTAVVIFFAFGCSPTANQYEKTIADFIQTDRKGVWTDLQFKALETTVSDVTVADSVAILQAKFEKELSEKISVLEKSVTHWEGAITRASDDMVGKVLRQGYEKDLDKARMELEQAKLWQPDYLKRYDGRNPSELLCKTATCRFTIINPMMGGAKQELTETFLISPDGSKCLRRVRGH